MIKLVSLNIERSKHLDLVIPFLKAQDGDVVCLQELMEYDISRFGEELGMHYMFAPGKIHPAEGKPGKFGEGIFSRLPILHSETSYYVGSAEHVIEVDLSDVHAKHATESIAALFCDIQKENETFRIGTTHFTWTPDGRPNEYQREDMKKLLAILDDSEEFVLCGDFNAPRGGEIFRMLADRYKDNVPLRYQTSIDGTLHRAGDLQLMVDGLFSTPKYAVSDVELHAGVSDHMAITATITGV